MAVTSRSWGHPLARIGLFDRTQLANRLDCFGREHRRAADSDIPTSGDVTEGVSVGVLNASMCVTDAIICEIKNFREADLRSQEPLQVGARNGFATGLASPPRVSHSSPISASVRGVNELMVFWLLR
jgi:hypothetical protein